MLHTQIQEISILLQSQETLTQRPSLFPENLEDRPQTARTPFHGYEHGINQNCARHSHEISPRSIKDRPEGFHGNSIGQRSIKRSVNLVSIRNICTRGFQGYTLGDYKMWIVIFNNLVILFISFLVSLVDYISLLCVNSQFYYSFCNIF